MNLIWEDPPSKRGRGRQFEIDAIVQQLKERPGQWAIVSPSVKNADGAAWKIRGCQTQSASNDDGTRRLYDRWPQTQAGDEPRES